MNRWECTHLVAKLFNALKITAIGLVMGAVLAGAAWAQSARPCTVKINGGNETEIKDRKLPLGNGENLEIIKGECTASGTGMYMYGNVNIYNGGKLTFLDSRGADIQFWAHSILIEDEGSLLAGTLAKPFGSLGGRLTIYVYGQSSDKGITCKIKKDEANNIGPCGVPLDVWNSNADPKAQPKTTTKIPGVSEDYFYNYDFMPFDNGEPDAPSYFGNKVLAVSFGGTLKLFGQKGATYDTLPASDSGISWGRLQGTIKPASDAKAQKFLTVDVGKKGRDLDWQIDDHIIVTTTDYMPDHSEELIIKAKPTDNKDGTFTIQYENADSAITTGVQWYHNGEKYPVSNDAHKGIDRLKLGRTTVDTRAAVGLLSRSIRIYSGGDSKGKRFDDESATYNFGAHTIARQGFAALQMQGVELRELGQGGLIGHYPVHLHMARKTPKDTFVRDCSIWDSMTRWIVLHATQGVELARNVGYKSIGSGFFIEDGTEVNNKLYSNLGVFARAAVDNIQNPRKVPGILADTYFDRPNSLAYDSDYDYPSVFWIMNGWNDFEYNMAAGAETCGACYWLVPGANSGQENTGKLNQPNSKMTWQGYAAMQSDLGRAATTPLMKFVGNSCASAMNSFETVANINACLSVGPPDTKDGRIPMIKNSKAPLAEGDLNKETYYPRLGNNRPATQCGSDEKAAETANCGDQAKFPKCTPGDIGNCVVTVLDNYTTSFNYAETNFAAVWLRQFWFLFVNSAITDVQNAGLTMITSGDYTRAAVIDGYWSLAKKDVFIGHTQNVVLGDNPVGNPYASSVGPFNPTTKLQCNKAFGTCFSRDDGLEMPASNFAVNQRFFNIYDGPSYEDSNAFLDISLDNLSCTGNDCDSNDFFKTTYGRSIGIPKDKGGKCYVPNAAIGWKQPNGFFYPPAFHSLNLYFDKVPLRHLVIEPLVDSQRKTDPTKIAQRYCTRTGDMFDTFNDIDRQTVVNDDDGSLTGLVANPVEDNERNEPKPDSKDEESAEKETISVNFGSQFFTNPIEAPECKSEIDNPPAAFPAATAKTIPYEFVSTVVYPACAKSEQSKPAPINSERCGQAPEPFPQDAHWNSNCTTVACYGVPLYRQDLVNGEAANDTQSIRMMGGNLWQRQSMTANNGTYFINTASGETAQSGTPNKNIFDPGKSYYVFLLYAKPTTHQVYKLYVGSGFDKSKNVFMTRVNPNSTHFTFTDNVNSMGNPEPLPSGWSVDGPDSNGILTVTVDMGFPEFAANYKKAQENFCAPSSFCKLEGKKCGCNPKSPDYQLCKDNDVCAIWAGKDVDWPDGGAYGFGIKFTGFVADDKDHRPTTSCVKKTDTGWNAPLERTSADLQGDCNTTPIPPTQFCP